MSHFEDISAEEAELVRIMSKLPEFEELENLDLKQIRRQIRHKITDTIRQYRMETSTNSNKVWSKKFEKAGITQQDIDSALTCIKKLGIDIS